MKNTGRLLRGVYELLNLHSLRALYHLSGPHIHIWLCDISFFIKAASCFFFANALPGSAAFSSWMGADSR